MAELSERDLLLLDNLMYYDSICWSPGTSVAKIAKSMRRNAGTPELFSGGLKYEEIINIAKEIESNPNLKNLKVAGSIDSKGVYAICFEGNGKGDATVAIRGTGGAYDPWSDNVYGTAVSDTDCQEAIGSFLKELGKDGYHDITITGHSKGGNLAQYGTITKGNLIDRCISFDGQGFGEDFLKKYNNKIADNCNKIKSINGDDDYVNILLDDSYISDKVYVDVDPEKANPHSSYALLENGDFNEDGYLQTTVPQSELMKEMDVLVDKLVKDLHEYPGIEKVLAGLLGAIAGMAFAFHSGKMSLSEVLAKAGAILNAARVAPGLAILVLSWLYKELLRLSKYANSEEFKNEMGAIDSEPIPTEIPSSLDTVGVEQIYIFAEELRSICESIAKTGQNISSIESELNNIANELAIEDGSQSEVRRHIRQIGSALEKKGEKLRILGEAGGNCSTLYLQTEKDICKH